MQSQSKHCLQNTANQSTFYNAQPIKTLLAIHNQSTLALQYKATVEIPTIQIYSSLASSMCPTKSTNTD